MVDVGDGNLKSNTQLPPPKERMTILGYIFMNIVIPSSLLPNYD